MPAPNEHAVQTSELDGGFLRNDTTSIFAQIERGLQRNPDGIAAICMHQKPDHLTSFLTPAAESAVNDHRETHCLTLTFAQIHGTAIKLASGLQKLGIRPEATVLLAIENGGEYLLLLWTCAILRLTLAAVHPSMVMASQASELQHYIESLRPGLVVTHNPEDAIVIRNSVEFLGLEQPVHMALTSGGIDAISMEEVAHIGCEWPCDQEALLKAARHDSMQRIHTILFTSGTSGGQPKGCAVRVHSMTHILEAQSWLIHSDNCIRVLQQAHISRAIGPQHILQTWRCGGAIVMPEGPSFSVKHTLEALQRHLVSFIVLSPAMVHSLDKMLQEYPEVGRHVLSVQVGGDAVTADVVRKCAALFPNADVFINHGMSEGGAVFKWPFFGVGPGDLPYLGGICPTGAVAAGTKVRILGKQQKAVARGEVGRLHLCSESIIEHYHNDVSPESFYTDSAGRWFDTGDLALMNADGIIYVLGRGKDAIERHGKTLMPVVLESCVEAYTGTQTVVLATGGPSSEQQLHIVLADDAAVDRTKLLERITSELGTGYAPDRIVSLSEIGLSRFPVNATHKIVRSALLVAVAQYACQSE